MDAESNKGVQIMNAERWDLNGRILLGFRRFLSATVG